MLNVHLWKNTQYRFSIGCVVHIVTSKEVIHYDIHLFIRQLLTIRNGCMTGKAEGNLMVDREAIVTDRHSSNVEKIVFLIR